MRTKKKKGKERKKKEGKEKVTTYKESALELCPDVSGMSNSLAKPAH